MNFTSSNRIKRVQDPIIPIVGQWIKENPDAISLGQGVVWYGPPDDIYDSVAEFRKDPSNHLYKAVHGIPALWDAIEQKLKSDNQITLTERQKVVVTSGGNLAFSNAVFAIADPGDEFILNLPFYFNHEMAITLASCQTVLVSTDEQYQLDINALEAAITTKTKAIVTVSPGNPTGVVLTKQSLIAVNTLCAEKGIYHIHDEAYEYFHYGDSTQFSPASIKGSDAHTISIYSMSKSYGFASWRVGYMIIPSVLFDPILKIQDTQIICPAVISQFAAVSALNAGKCWIDKQQLPIKQARKIVVSALKEISDISSYPESTGAFYFYLKFDTKLDSLELCTRLISEHGIAVIPGVTFGSKNGTYVRIAYGALTPATAEQGIQRLISGIKQLVKQ